MSFSFDQRMPEKLSPHLLDALNAFVAALGELLEGDGVNPRALADDLQKSYAHARGLVKETELPSRDWAVRFLRDLDKAYMLARGLCNPEWWQVGGSRPPDRNELSRLADALADRSVELCNHQILQNRDGRKTHRSARGAPVKYRKAIDLAMKRRKRKPSPRWKEIYEECRTAGYFGDDPPTPESFKRTVLRHDGKKVT